MNKVGLLKPLNTLLALSAMVQLLSVIIMLFHIKVLNPHLVFEIHKYNGILFFALAITHITLNFGWIKANILKIKARP